MGLHPRGNFEGFVHAGSRQKWLEVHGDTHWTHFYTNHGLGLQKRFFGHFLKGEDTGWAKQPAVQLQVRHVDGYVARAEREWPLARTEWTRFYLDPARSGLGRLPSTAAATIPYEALGEGLLFLTDPFAAETEITGPMAAKLFLSSSTSDADVFLGLHLFRPDGNEVTFLGANDPHVPVGQGWLRASHRKLDPARTLPYRPYHTHDEVQPLVPGEPVELDVEIWPTSVVVPAGYRLGLTVRGKDITPDDPATRIGGVAYKRHANIGPFKHNHPQDRPPEIFGGTNTLHISAQQQPFLLLPIIPARN
jgi:predicted acyl esterase